MSTTSKVRGPAWSISDSTLDPFRVFDMDGVTFAQQIVTTRKFAKMTSTGECKIVGIEMHNVTSRRESS
jgi:hypothetical protein